MRTQPEGSALDISGEKKCRPEAWIEFQTEGGWPPKGAPSSYPRAQLTPLLRSVDGLLDPIHL